MTYGQTLNRPYWPANPDRWNDGPNSSACHSCVHYPDVLQPRAKQCTLCCSRLTTRIQGNSYTDFRNGCRFGQLWACSLGGLLFSSRTTRSSSRYCPTSEPVTLRTSRTRSRLQSLSRTDLSRKSVLDSRPGWPFSSLTERRGFTFWSS